MKEHAVIVSRLFRQLRLMKSGPAQLALTSWLLGIGVVFVGAVSKVYF